jgi:hypothetical protein
LYALNGRDLHDIGIAHGDIEYVASNPNLDPRGHLTWRDVALLTHSQGW